jgi:hypothetical protein
MLERNITLMRPVEFGEALAIGTRLTLFSQDKPDRFFRVIKFWMDETWPGAAPTINRYTNISPGDAEQFLTAVRGTDQCAL